MVERRFCKPLVGGSIPLSGSNFMSSFITTFLLVFFTNITYTYYLKAVQKSLPTHASLWAALVTAISCLAVVCYVTNPWLILPAVCYRFLYRHIYQFKLL